MRKYKKTRSKREVNQRRVQKKTNPIFGISLIKEHSFNFITSTREDVLFCILIKIN